MDGYCYSLLLEKSRKIWQHITFDPKDKKYKNVEIAGDMNEWTPGRTPMHLKDGTWQTDMLLFPGKYQYKLVLDKKWVLDPGNPENVDNNIGGTNSLLRAGAVNPSGAPYLFTKKAEKIKSRLESRIRPGKYLSSGRITSWTKNSGKLTAPV